MNTSSTATLYHDYVMSTYARFDTAFVRGEGVYLWDEEGKVYLDFGAGIAVSSLGHAHPKLVKTVAEQAARLLHVSNLYLTRPQAELAKFIVDLVGLGGKVFFCNSGAEANEGLYKLARQFGAPTKRYQIITFNNSFHGRTLGGISATGQDKVKAGFSPLVPGFIHVPLNDLEVIEAAITPQTVAILLEPVQGEGGINAVNAVFLKELKRLCEQNNLLLLFDEVQCGLGRTGDWCAWRTIVPSGLEPDAVSWGKGIAGGVPLGAFWAGTRSAGHDAYGSDRGMLCNILSPGSHGTTYGGNPLATSAGLTVLKTIQEEGMLQNARAMGNYLMQSINDLQLPAIRLVRGVGLMIGIELHNLPSVGLPSIIATKALMKSGLLVIPSGERTIRLLPPLNINKEHVDESLAILKKVFLTLIPN